MPVETDIDLSGLDALMGGEALERAQLLLAQRVADDFKLNAPAGHHVPRDTGMLQDTVEVSGRDEVTWPMEYAAAVYEGTEKRAGRPWFEQGKAEQANAWAGYVGRILTEGAQ